MLGRFGTRLTPFDLMIMILIVIGIFIFSLYKFKTTYSNKKIKYQMAITFTTAILSFIILSGCMLYKVENWKGWFIP